MVHQNDFSWPDYTLRISFALDIIAPIRQSQGQIIILFNYKNNISKEFKDGGSTFKRAHRRKTRV